MDRSIRVRILRRILATAALQMRRLRIRQLIHHIRPLDHTPHVEIRRRRKFPQRIAPPLSAFITEWLKRVPHPQNSDEVTLRILPCGMRLIGLARFFRRPLTRIVGFQKSDDRQNFSQAMFLARLNDHPRQPRIDRHPRHFATVSGELPITIERADLTQRAIPLGHGLRRWSIKKRKLIDLRQTQRLHPQNHPRQRTAANLGISELRPFLELQLLIQPHAHSIAHSPATALSLTRTSPTHRLDQQTLHTLARTPPTHPRHTGINHTCDARNRQRCLRHIRRQNQTPQSSRMKHPLLIRQTQPRKQGQHFGVAKFSPFKHLRTFANLALTRQKHQHIPTRIHPTQPLNRTRDMLRHFLVIRRRQEKL